MKKLSRGVVITIVSLFLVLSIALAVIFTYAGVGGKGFFSFASNDGIDLGIYITVKALVSLAAIAMLILHLSGKRSEGIIVIDVILTAVIQLLPLVVRSLAQFPVYFNDTVTFIWAINLSISIIVIFVYVTIVLLITLSNHRMNETKAKVKPESEKIVERNVDSALDENGNFVGPKK